MVKYLHFWFISILILFLFGIGINHVFNINRNNLNKHLVDEQSAEQRQNLDNLGEIRELDDDGIKILKELSRWAIRFKYVTKISNLELHYSIWKEEEVCEYVLFWCSKENVEKITEVTVKLNIFEGMNQDLLREKKDEIIKNVEKVKKFIEDHPNKNNLDKTILLHDLIEKKWIKDFDKVWTKISNIKESYRGIENTLFGKEEYSPLKQVRDKVKTLLFLSSDEKLSEQKKKIQDFLLDKNVKQKPKIREAIKQIIRSDWLENNYFEKQLEKIKKQFEDKNRVVLEKLDNLKKAFDDPELTEIKKELTPEETDLLDKKIKKLLQRKEDELWKMFGKILFAILKNKDTKESKRQISLKLWKQLFNDWKMWKDFKNYRINKIIIKGEEYEIEQIKNFDGADVDAKKVEKILFAKTEEIKGYFDKELEKEGIWSEESVKEINNNLMSLLKEERFKDVPFKNLEVNGKEYEIDELIDEIDEYKLTEKANKQWKELLKEERLRDKKIFASKLENAKTALIEEFWKTKKEWFKVLKKRGKNFSDLNLNKLIKESDEQNANKNMKNTIIKIIKSNYQGEKTKKGNKFFQELQESLKNEIEFILNKFKELKEKNVTKFWFERVGVETNFLQRINNPEINLENLGKETRKEILKLLDKEIDENDFDDVVVLNDAKTVCETLRKEKKKIVALDLRMLEDENDVLLIDSNLMNEEVQVEQLKKYRKTQLAKFIRKNLKEIIDRTINNKLEKYWKIVKDKKNLLKKYDVEILEIKDDKKNKWTINLKQLIKQDVNRASELSLQNLTEIQKLSDISEQKFEQKLVNKIKKSKTFFNYQEENSKKEQSSPIIIITSFIAITMFAIGGSALLIKTIYKKYS